MTTFASRKFIASIAALISAHWALYERLIESGDYKAIVIGTIGLYVTGNVAQKAVEKRGTP